MRSLSAVVIGMCLFVSWAAAGQANSSQPRPTKGTPTADKKTTQSKDVFWVIPHTHWEGAVFKTREEYLDIGFPTILEALRLLETHPEYCFVLDQVAYVRPILERYPEEEGSFRKLVAEGRLQLVGANIVMPDNNMPGGESWVRQALYGKGYYKDKLGVDVTVGWALDTFGHHAQMPQLLKLAGYNSYWFFRGVRSLDTPSEFFWQGIDGTQVPAFWLPQAYIVMYPTPSNLTEFDSFARGEFGRLGPFARGPNRVAVAGADVAPPEDHLPAMVAQFNQQADAPFTIRFGVPTDYEAAVAQGSARPVVTGELNPVFQGIYSSRIELKQWIRKLESLLTTWEKFNVLARWLGKAPDEASLAAAWDPMLFNQTHDLASGVMTDHVYEDTVRGYEFAKRLADENMEARWNDVSAKIDTTGAGLPVVVLNTLGWPRTDIVEVEVGFTARGVTGLSLLDSTGRAVPAQVVREERFADGTIEQARIAFVARDVPSLGYSVYQVVDSRATQAKAQTDQSPREASSTSMHQDTASIENEYYRATVNLWTGEIRSLVLKSNGWEVLGGPANVVAREQDGGDFWELYGTLNGARAIAMTREVLLPQPGRAQFSNEWVGGSGRTSQGPVISEFRVSHPFGDGTIETSVRMYAGVARVGINTKILNNDKLVRYRALFPTSIQGGTRVDEIPFGSIERPLAEEYPAQNWIDYGDGTRGVALLNRGLPGNNVIGGTLALSLMRSARINAYGYGGGYGPGNSSDSGFEIGKELTFDYALVPHAGDWREAGVYRAGMEFNNPLLARKVSKHPGILPKRWGLLEVSHLNVVMTALKSGRDGSAVLRVYEASGRPTAGVKLKLNAKITSAEESNLIEAAGRQLSAQDDTLQFDLRAYEVKTFKLQLKPAKGRE
jgi:alpha-mannosidase